MQQYASDTCHFSGGEFELQCSTSVIKHYRKSCEISSPIEGGAHTSQSTCVMVLCRHGVSAQPARRAL